MRPPADKRSTDEIIADIMELVGYRPAEVLVRRRISDLCTTPPPFTGNQKKNVEHAKDLRKLIIKIERMLKAPQSKFLGDRFWSLWSRKDARGSAIEINFQTRSYIAQEPTRLKYLVEELNFIRSRCDQIIKLKLGKHGNIKPQHANAAIASLEVLEVVASHKATELQLGCAPTSTFVEVACLFHEAATGKYGANLVRACKALKVELDAKT